MTHSCRPSVMRNVCLMLFFVSASSSALLPVQREVVFADADPQQLELLVSGVGVLEEIGVVLFGVLPRRRS